ncbi:hypothetical protein FZ025_03680 [Xanthomonas hyacinthi]|uniref:Secreted protein n=1 Tax=Xanthomonas hyacinthi TaxID=56455 RepID=A0A2S7F2M2_9XANT|nr:hypothetical protein [Xanthomonas hyacinthi]KLD77202.1 hypothetical protein Y886_17090 [Xanthomonas hyacinthi DSM 19077]PPU99665.1 hypothetical protein XhyaCFBP1156_00350 [Xanthomonas hyacinthi]QGY75807.1 hypothetical protein FZ025_03680 [Xanthomonas hyacinthi]
MLLARLTPLVLCAVLAVAAAPAAAQRAVAGDLQTQMSAQQFKAAGLDKLSPQELAALNDWLQGKVANETAVALQKAKEEGRQEVIVKNRGFFDFGSQEPIESTLVGEFTGFSKGRRYVLANGQEWEQTESASLSSVHRSAPKVKITPGIMGVWYLQIDNYNTRAKVRRIK